VQQNEEAASNRGLLHLQRKLVFKAVVAEVIHDLQQVLRVRLAIMVEVVPA
jgi:hypothetical protein